MNAFTYPASVGEQTIADLIASNNEQRLRARREAALRAGGAARSTNSGSSTAAHRESESLSERGTTLAPKAASSALGRGFWFSVGALIALAVVLSWRV